MSASADSGIALARLVIIAVLAAAAAVLPMRTPGPGAAPLVDSLPLETPLAPAATGGREAARAGAQPIDPATAPPLGDAAAHAEPASAWFDATELKLSGAGGDKPDILIDPNACVYPDSFLRELGGGRDDCGFLRPGPDESAVLTLPFIALLAWTMVICAVAVLYRFGRDWRARRWLRRMQARGLAPGGPAVYPRHSSHRRTSRSGRHRRAAPRRSVG